MEKFLTLEILIDLPKKLLTKAENLKIENMLTLLSNNMIQKYYYKDLRKDLIKCFSNFNDSKIYFSNIADDYQLTSNYELKENKHIKNTNDKISSFVEQKIMNQRFTVNMYNRIESLICKLTYQESIYFVKTFLYYDSEESISEDLAISRTYLQKIKKSCLVKMRIEFLENH